MSRKLTLYVAAVVIGLSGVAISQWLMTSLKPSVALAAAYPVILLATGLVGGLFVILAEPNVRNVPKASNDHGPPPNVQKPGRTKVRKRVRLA